MKKLLSTAIASLILFPSVLSSQAVAQGNNENGRSTQTLLAQANPAQQVQQLFEEAQQLTAEQKYQQAEQKYQQILNIVTQATSADNPELAQVYFSLGVLDHKQLNLSAAKADYEDAVRVNPEYIPAINNLGLIAYEAGEVDRAIEYWQSAIEINNNSSVIEAKLALAVAFYQQGKREQGLFLAKQALGEDIEFANLAVLKQNLWGDKLLKDTEILLANKQVKVFVPDIKIATSHNNLALHYVSQGKYAEAKTLLIEALAILRQRYKGDHSSVATSLNNLGSLYDSQGRYGDAEPLLQQALAMRQRLFPQDHPSVATSLNNLGLLYDSQGRYGDAEPLLQQALAMRQRLFPQDHPSVANSLNSLAVYYRSQERYSEAELLYQDALVMRKRLFPQDHPDVAESLNNLAFFYNERGKYREAKSLYIEALAMRKRLFKNDHPDVATSLNNLASLYDSQGKYNEAESLYQKALIIFKRLYQDNHFSLAISLSNIAVLYLNQEKYLQSLPYLTQASEVEEAIISENLLIGSEQQKKQFFGKFKNSTYTTISFHLQALPDNVEAAELALTTILRRKGRVLDATGQALQTLRDNLDSESQQLFTQLASTQTQLANLSSRPLLDDATQRENIQVQQNQLDKQIKQLEARLSSRSAEFKQETTPVTIEQVQQAIPSNAALVEFIQYKPFDAKKITYGEPRYAVYVLLPDGQIQWQDLGEASVIDDKIQRFRTLLGNSGERGLGAVQAESGIDATKNVARELDETLMKPVRVMVGDASHLLLSPDSQLNTLPFAALVDEQDKYLVENYLITYLTSGRDLLRLQLNQNQETSQPLLLANPTYSSPGVATKSDTKPKEDSSRGRRSGELGKLEFASLPGTKVEGEAIEQIVPNIKVLTEGEASENNLKQTENPEFLHLATHGFFLPPQEEELNNDRNGALSLDSQTPAFSTAENPLLRSGLALAGFNQRDSGTQDGVLTALEVTGLNLRGTKLVVMSACETGLGDVQAGEGVYGLRRAFTLAGAQSQLMSLWSVDDEGTKDLMVDYYRRIQNGEARGEALRQVQLEMLESKDRNHPFFWAAFIPSGSWKPLDSDN